MSSKRRRLIRPPPLPENHCPLWPSCCSRRLSLFAKAFLRAEDEGWTLEQIKAAETVIFKSLRCVEKHSHDPVERREATLQLLYPFWDRQRRGEELADNG